jgi:hypothetical protein
MAKVQPKQTPKETPKYINGLFITKKEGQYGEYFSVGITQEGLDALKDLEPSASGFRNFTFSPQKADPNKYSCKPSVAKASDSDTLPW